MANQTRVYFLYKNNNLFSIKSIGHAEFSVLGKDIVCAGISSVIFGFLNAIESFDVNIEIVKEKAMINIEFNESNEKINNYGELLLIQLNTISHVYSKNLKITIRKE